MPILEVKHTTIYRYSQPVRFGDHRLMFRPRDSHDMRLREALLTISPAPASIRWLHDVFGNSIAIASFDAMADELRFESVIRLEPFPIDGPEFPIEEYARVYPFSYSAEEIPDLGRTTERHYPDPEHKVDAWAREFVVNAGQPADTLAVLAAMTEGIRSGFTYCARNAEGTQSPVQTLESRSGTCRDYALLMMEAVRSLGLAARFVTGYLYDPARDSGGNGEGGEGGAPTVGGGATHAWVQVYLPGAGWAEFDPTNGIIGSRNLIRVAVTRDPSQAVPLAGSWIGGGEGASFLGMTIDVQVNTAPICE